LIIVYAYGKDACIISYIFNYKVKLIQNNIYVSTFTVEKFYCFLLQKKMFFAIKNILNKNYA